MEEKPLEHLEGTVEDVVYHNEDTGFTVLDVAVEEELVTVVGQSVGAGDREQVRYYVKKLMAWTYGMMGVCNIALTIYNRKGFTLPHTGADAPSLWLLIGLPALVAVLLVLVFRYNKKGGKHS